MNPRITDHCRAAMKPRHNDRRCIATGAALPPGARAIRFVRSPSGEAVPDLSSKLPGRGAWVTASRAAVLQAAKKSAFSRAFKEQTNVPGGAEAFADEVGRLVRERALERLGLARRAGALLTGFETVREKTGKLCAYLYPEDAAADGVTKIVKKLAATSGAPHIRFPAPGAVIAQAVGVPAAVHLGLVEGGAGRAAAEAAAFWAEY
jgi:predicted RNA-binding protein YlxR (DUF448 family)